MERRQVELWGFWLFYFIRHHRAARANHARASNRRVHPFGQGPVIPVCDPWFQCPPTQMAFRSPLHHHRRPRSELDHKQQERHISIKPAINHQMTHAQLFLDGKLVFFFGFLNHAGPFISSYDVCFVFVLVMCPPISFFKQMSCPGEKTVNLTRGMREKESSSSSIVSFGVFKTPSRKPPLRPNA